MCFGAQKNRLDETVLLSTHNICFGWGIIKIIFSHAKLFCVKLRLFSHPWVKTCVLGALKNRLVETVVLSTHNICFGWGIRKIIFSYALLSGGLDCFSWWYPDMTVGAQISDTCDYIFKILRRASFTHWNRITKMFIAFSTHWYRISMVLMGSSTSCWNHFSLWPL